ncbi:MAG TPA: SDR family oxidoreductase [Elusimicrobiota bacterium]|nr:SDR family oxidoreductase [Elusimicrobiota bacterium]
MGTVLVAGGAGYIGSILCRELLELGFSVRVADRFFYGNAGVVGIKDRIEILEKDLRQIAESDLKGVDACINLAGLSNDPTAEYNPDANWDMNALGAEHLAQVCRSAGVWRYILASSASVYDRGGQQEEQDVVLTEESEVFPKAAYAVSKLEGEKRVLALKNDRFSPIILRKGTVHGFSPRMRYDLVVNTFVKDALGSGTITLFYGGEMWRPLVEIRDVARAYIAALQAPLEKVRGEIFNVVEKNYRISELALHVQGRLEKLGIRANVAVDYAYRSVRSYRVSSKKIRQTLGWAPLVAVEDSVELMVKNIRECGYTNFDYPRYYNIEWMKLLQEAQTVSSRSHPQNIFKVPDETTPPAAS